MAIKLKINDQELDAERLLSCEGEFKSLAHLVLEAHITIPYAIPAPGIGRVRLSLWPPGIFNALKKFSAIERATIEFCVENPSSGTLLRWRTNSSGFILLLAKKMVADDQRKPILLTATEITDVEKSTLAALKKHCVSDSKFRVQHMRYLVDILPNIKQIRGLDSQKRGTVVLEEDDITHLRMKIPRVCRDMDIDIEDILGEVWRNLTWKALTVRSEKVFLVLTRRDVVSDETMAENCFEETDYSELAMEMIKTKYCYSTSSCLGKFYFLDF